VTNELNNDVGVAVNVDVGGNRIGAGFSVGVISATGN
jgi:hypothetical protein